MNVQYRSTPVVLTDQMTAIAEGDASGRLLVTAAPPTPATFSEVHSIVTGGATGFAVSTLGPQVECVLTKLYVGVKASLATPGTYFVVIVDKLGALVNGDRSIIPTPKITTGGELFFWEPPGGVKFSNGIAVALSSTPLLYTAVAEECTVSGWTY